jgi:hypothetical protein
MCTDTASIDDFNSRNSSLSLQGSSDSNPTPTTTVERRELWLPPNNPCLCPEALQDTLRKFGRKPATREGLKRYLVGRVLLILR